MKNEILNDKELYDSILNKFRSLTAQKARFKEKLKKYKAQAKAPVDEKLTYKSSSDIALDIRVSGSSKGAGPQEAPTISFRGLGEELMELGAYIADLEEALYGAIDSAVLEAKMNQRTKIKKALIKHLIYDEPPGKLDIEWHTLKKYKDFAVVYAAENLNYIENRQKTHRRKKQEVENKLRTILTANR